MSLEWIERLAGALSQMREAPDAPLLDIDWLLLRCEDTLRYEGQLQQASARQLVKHVTEFEQRLPHRSPGARLPRPDSAG